MQLKLILVEMLNKHLGIFLQDVLSDPQPWNSESLKSQSGSSSHLEKPSGIFTEKIIAF